MKSKNGFTLIELLVVIAIIALLMAIIIPSLRKAKELATGVICLSNQHQLCLSWTAYADDNDSSLIGGSNYYNWHPTPYRWVEEPLYNETDNPEAGVPLPSASNDYTMERRLNGIRAGKLFPYAQDTDLYHCPGDRTFVQFQEPYAAWRSYAISGLMNGEDFVSRQSGLYSSINGYRVVGGKTLYCVEKYNQIKSPGNKYVFVEERYGGEQPYNAGSFVLFHNDTPFSWWDAPADYHTGKATFGFADGHADSHKWEDPRTTAWINNESVLPDGNPMTETQPGNKDLEWMIRGYLPK